MARIAAGRPSAEPSSPEQHDRRERILRAAARIGAEKSLGASMADVESDVRLACRLLLAPRSNAASRPSR